MENTSAPALGAFCLPSEYQQLIHQSRYARWLDDKRRRETWEETVERYVQFVIQPVAPEYSDELRDSILRLDVLPSMRAIMTAGPAAERSNIAIFNCAYTPVEHPKRFHEILYILMCGTGIGFSVERQDINRLPLIPKLASTGPVHTVKDSKEGWALAFKHTISSLYHGTIPTLDYSKVRPAGARLKTFGGRASGPGPLKNLIDFTIRTFTEAQGRRLTSIEVHDIVCMTGKAVEVGGVRRSALISLSNLSDGRMANAKSGSWWESNPQRAGANNSAVYEGTPDVGSFMEEWLTIYRSNSGERGIFNREACRRLCSRIGRDPDHAWGTNP